MAKAFIPRIPRGNLGLVYVLSKTAADEFFREATDSVKKHWPIPREYKIPDTKRKAILISAPHVSFPWKSAPFYDKPYTVRGQGGFGISVGYTGECSVRGGLGKIILSFVCEAERRRDRKTHEDAGWFVPGSNVFIYSMYEHEKISLPDEAFKYDGVRRSTIVSLNEDIKPAFKSIEEEIRAALEKRGAVLTRGWLGDRFVS